MTDFSGIDEQSTAGGRLAARRDPVRLLPAVDSTVRAGYFASLRGENALALLPVAPVLSVGQRIRSLRPDVVAIATEDISTAAWRNDKLLQEALSTVPAILLTKEVSPSSTRLAAGIHIRSVLALHATPLQLAAAIQAVAAGLVVGSEQLSGEADEDNFADDSGLSEEPLMEHLTPREATVLRLMALGRGNKEIAALLNISEHTAKFHVSSILAKLGANSRTEAVTLGILRGLVAI
ncbi:MAG: response regulator transcription factor [Terracidiphilus sp.]